MLLVDVGNTNIKIYNDGKIITQKATTSANFPKEKFYYICVNIKLVKTLQNLQQAIDLEPMIDLKSSYEGLGVDRKVVCKAVKNGVIVDAGSAITVDVMRDEKHMGGFITLGIGAFRQSFANISDRLVYDLDATIDLNNLPQNTDEALNFATFCAIRCSIDSVKGDLPLIFCGGDGEVLSKMFKDSEFKKDLVFQGMKEVIGC
jgi:type III pantothenate kinase